MQSQTPMFYALIAFWYALGMSALGFALFCYLELRAESRLRNIEQRRDALPNVGEIAEKFSKAGASSSALACSVLFMLIATAIALGLDKLKINPFW